MSKTKLVFLAIGNSIICAQAFLMIGMAMADSRIVLEPGIGALVIALVLFVTSGVNLTVIHELQKRFARRRREAARQRGDGRLEPRVEPPLSTERALLDAFAREMAEGDNSPRRARRRLRPVRPRARRAAG